MLLPHKRAHSLTADLSGAGIESGQAVVLLVVVSSLFMFGALGLAIDAGQMYAHRQMAQAAADAAAQAAIMSIYGGTNSTSAHPFSTASSFTCTVPPATLDLRTPCVYAQYNGFSKQSDTVTVSFPSTVSGVTLSSVSTPAVAVSVQRVLATTFMHFLGPASATIIAKSTAGMVGTGSSQCLYILDPSASNAMVVSGGSTSVTMDCGIAVNSSSSGAVKVSGGATVTSSAFTIVGGDIITGSSTVSPTPTTGAAAVADPFSGLTGPTVGSCDYTNYHLSGGTGTLNPGTYCGGLSISGGANATFSPGTYIIKGGGLTISSSTATGSGVMFYLTGTNSSYRSATISGGSIVTLSAETSGPYLGILFFQDRSLTPGYDGAFSGGSDLNLTGSIYFPTTSLTFSGGTSTNSNTAIVAQTVTFSGASRMNYDPTGTKTGLGNKTVGLLQ